MSDDDLYPTRDQLDIPFAYANPYSVQVELMKSIFLSINERRVSIMESPTGTGKTLSIICASLYWLCKHYKSHKQTFDNNNTHCHADNVLDMLNNDDGSRNNNEEEDDEMLMASWFSEQNTDEDKVDHISPIVILVKETLARMGSIADLLSPPKHSMLKNPNPQTKTPTTINSGTSNDTDEDKYCLLDTTPTPDQLQLESLLESSHAHDKELLDVTGCRTLQEATTLIREVLTSVHRDPSVNGVWRRGIDNIFGQVQINVARSVQGSNHISHQNTENKCNYASRLQEQREALGLDSKNLSERIRNVFSSNGSMSSLNGDGHFVIENIRSAIKMATQGIGVKIIYAARTHTQLDQFVGEVKKALSALPSLSNINVVSLASRALLCNHISNKTTSTNLKKIDRDYINDYCKDLRASDHGCLYLNDAERQLWFREAMKTKVRDIEETTELGNQLETCSYYGSKLSIKGADIIAVPYQFLFHKNTRLHSGLEIDNNIVIIDEAHNIIETINNVNSVEINASQLFVMFHCLFKYFQRFQYRFTESNRQMLLQMLMIVLALYRFVITNEEQKHSICNSNNTNHSGNNIKNNNNINNNNNVKNSFQNEDIIDGYSYSIDDVFSYANINNINIFKLVTWIKHTKLLFKLASYSEVVVEKEHEQEVSKKVASNHVDDIGDNSAVNIYRKTLKLHKRQQSLQSANSESSTVVSKPFVLSSIRTTVSFIESLSRTHDQGRVLLSKPQYQDQPHIHNSNEDVLDDSMVMMKKHDDEVGFDNCVSMREIHNRLLESMTVNLKQLQSPLSQEQEHKPRQQSLTQLFLSQSTWTYLLSTSIKHILIDPSVVMSEIHSKARSVILTGGTMQPFDIIQSQLMSGVKERDVGGSVTRTHIDNYHSININNNNNNNNDNNNAVATVGDTNGVVTFTCGHVVDQSRVLTLCISQCDIELSSSNIHQTTDITTQNQSTVVKTTSDAYTRLLDKHGYIDAQIDSLPAMTETQTVTPPPNQPTLTETNTETTAKPAGWLYKKKPSAHVNTAATTTQRVPTVVPMNQVSHNNITTTSQQTLSTKQPAPMTFSYATRNQHALFVDLGLTIESIVSKTPGGTVVFFSSYDQLDSALRVWRRQYSQHNNNNIDTGENEPHTKKMRYDGSNDTKDNYSLQLKSKDTLSLLHRLNLMKHVFRESRTPDHTDSEEPSCSSVGESVWDQYCHGISHSHGSLLLCVIGGKMSEGINFNDELARCVVVVGLPYPSLYDIELRERLNFIDKRAQSQNHLVVNSNTQNKLTINDNISGNLGNAAKLYYNSLCMRAVNQSIGRAIRHKDDYACIVLIDTRFSQTNIQQQLPKWLGNNSKVNLKTSEAVEDITRFFNKFKIAPQP